VALLAGKHDGQFARR
jgi:hypothetical protein